MGGEKDLLKGLPVALYIPAQIETQGLKYLLLITNLSAAYWVGRAGLEFRSLWSGLLA